ncbi:MAG: apolipoprotein N-acyltransferase [Gammaproteobacteria bacterium]|jgi:apolipoprotein N-acyltransferase
MKIKHITNLVSLIAGGILPLAFAPWHYFWLAPLTTAILLYIWLKSTPWHAALNGWLFGIGLFGVGASWVYISMHRFGGASILLSTILTALFIITLALFFAAQGYCMMRFAPKKFVISFPIFWVLFEWLRSHLFTGFPWLLLGYSQTNSPLRGYAPIIGVYGISFLVALSAALIIMSFRGLIAESRNFKHSFLCFIILILIWIIGGLLTPINWAKPIGKPITVSIVQGNIPQQLKWLPNQIAPTIQHYKNLTQPYWDSDIILWPEAAIPLPLPYAQTFVNQLSITAKKHHASLILGIPIQINSQYYNAAIALGAGSGKYYKQRLVPFGEYVPFENILRGLFTFFDLPMSEFIKGPKKQDLLRAGNVLIAPYICYEAAYAHLVHRNLPKAQLLITISNDAWFGKSIAAAQHLQIGQMRCLETGRYMLFSTNNGITAIINPQGKIVKRLPRFQTSVLTGKVYAMQGTTPCMWLY